MLNFNEFQEHIKNTILDYLPEEFSDAKVDLQQVAKNNEMLTGIMHQRWLYRTVYQIMCINMILHAMRFIAQIRNSRDRLN